MCTRHHAEHFGVADAHKAHEVLEVVLVRAPGLRVRDIGEPLDLRRDVSQVEELLRSERAVLVWD
jgi:hypothetical protein